MQYHIFTITLTIIFYVFVKYFLKEKDQQKTLIYTAFIPVTLYGYRYFTLNESTTLQPEVESSVTELMSDAYPSFSSSNS
jgi:hypothetical protein